MSATRWMAAALIAAWIPLASATTDERIKPALEEIQKLVAASGDGPGIAIGVSDRERLLGVVVHGYADLKTAKPVTPDTKFAIGSISKSFTAVVLLQMADAKKFDPAAPISKYLPQFRVNTTYPAITGHSVLNHTSGLPNYLPHLSSMRYALYALHDFQPTYAPGDHFEYSNTGYQILGYVAERIDGDSFPSILERRILEPLGMHATEPQMDDTVRQSLAISYERWPYDGSYVESNWFPYTASDGGIASNTEDFGAYVRFILNRGVGPKGRILSPAAFEAFITPALDNYAYGVNVSRAAGKTVVGHGGSIYGFNSYFEAHIDEGFGLTFLSNTRLDSELVGRVIGIASKALGGNGQPATYRKFTNPPAQDWNDTSRYEGTYLRQDGVRAVFSKGQDGRLLMRSSDGKQVELRRMGRNIYGGRATGAYLFFGDSEVSHGADWYTKEGAAVPESVTTPAEYRAYVGRYQNHNNEGPDVRVFVRRGRLMVTSATSTSFTSELVAVSPGVFRLETPSHSPERYQFDTLDDGVTLRLQVTGVPLYRVDLP
ncbi:serine hydrolase domain-containing protein [Steroidobacter flavus]|uniref:Serine hydrolase domain-containing protein n=1 Tax=Steroidobacter flavus TaxID=1842136 RepID=A0ABV8T667_9GAMM